MLTSERPVVELQVHLIKQTLCCSTQERLTRTQTPRISPPQPPRVDRTSHHFSSSEPLKEVPVHLQRRSKSTTRSGFWRRPKIRGGRCERVNAERRVASISHCPAAWCE